MPKVPLMKVASPSQITGQAATGFQSGNTDTVSVLVNKILDLASPNFVATNYTNLHESNTEYFSHRKHGFLQSNYFGYAKISCHRLHRLAQMKCSTV